jgi:hypothetical protein
MQRIDLVQTADCRDKAIDVVSDEACHAVFDDLRNRPKYGRAAGHCLYHDDPEWLISSGPSTSQELAFLGVVYGASKNECCPST